ncbi:hypothetical protein [Nocardia flavorosea]|uniref:Uncharacterized protein n=1 Tax=Nocardia flavorosea TaxID=53429 RepID=A0A846YPE9_9NOCA|nr:hypothetical protein [Nocardia flavorosea]NKY59591.1 hypothetical protein [Nocardia flavorosea]
MQADPEAEPAAESADPDQGMEPEADPDAAHAATAAGMAVLSPEKAGGFGLCPVRSRGG